MSDVNDLIPGLVRHALDPATTVQENPLDATSWGSFWSRCQGEGLLLVLDRAVLAGDFAVTAEQGRQLAGAALRHAASVVRVERTLIEVTSTVAAAGFDVAVLKGLPNALRFWPDPEMRMVRDVDLLVRSADIDDVVELLVGAGATRLVPELRSGFDRRFGKAVTVRTADGVELDIHRTLVYGPHAFLVSEESLWHHVVDQVVVGNTTVRCFDPPAALIHACLHALSGGGRRRTADLLEVLMISQHRSLAIEAVAPVGRAWLAAAAVVDSCESAAELVGDGPAAVIAGQLVVSDEERRLQSVYEGSPSARRLAFATVRSISGLRAKVAYLAALALPSRENLRSRHLGRSTHLSSVLPRRRRR